MRGPVGRQPGGAQRYAAEQALLPPLSEPDPWSYVAKMIAARAPADPQALWRRFAARWNRLMREHPVLRTRHGHPTVMFCEWCGRQLGTDRYCPPPASCKSEATAAEHGRTLKRIKPA